MSWGWFNKGRNTSFWTLRGRNTSFWMARERNFSRLLWRHSWKSSFGYGGDGSDLRADLSGTVLCSNEMDESLFADLSELTQGKNCSVVVSWYNESDDVSPVVTNTTIEAKVRLILPMPGVMVLGLRFRRPGPVMTIVLYTVVNVLATSVVPMPIATSLVPLSTILFGFFGGMALNVLTTCLGAYLGLLLVRYGCRRCLCEDQARTSAARRRA